MSLFRNTVWFVKGLSEYTKSGYLAAAKKFRQADLENVDCSGKVYMVTGANSGLGKQTASEIAQRGGTVHLVCRNPTTAQEAKEEIVSATNNENVHVHILDMSQIKSVQDFAQRFKEEHPQLDCLVNNAGCMVNTREVTPEGLEKNFATNVLGTHVLVLNLIPLIEKSLDPRVIIVSSGGMLTQKMDLSDLQAEKMSKFDGTMVYAQNKRQQVVMTHQYAKEYPKIQFSSMHPGWADTPAVRSSMPEFYEKMKNKLRSTAEGADTIVWLAVSPMASLAQAKEQSGAFYQDRIVVNEHLPLAWTKSTTAEEEKLMQMLKDISQKTIGSE